MKYIIPIIVIILVLVLILTFKNKKPVTEIKTIKELDYSYTKGYAMNADISYKITCSDECKLYIKPYGIPEEETKEYSLSNDEIAKIITILNKYHVSKWNNFSKADQNVLDGDSFHFYLKEIDDTSISASGYMKYPENYREVKSELEAIFNEFEK